MMNFSPSRRLFSVSECSRRNQLNRTVGPNLRKMTEETSDLRKRALHLFSLCDKEEKGFVTKRDMQVCNCFVKLVIAVYLVTVFFIYPSVIL